MVEQLSADAKRILNSLEQRRLLLVQDAKLPSLVAEVVGQPISGSWWGHPASHDIFRVLNELADHEDVFLARLLNRKQTLIHRALFPALVAIGAVREAWQLHGLSGQARALLAQVDQQRRVRASGDDARQLELVLLVASREVHTDSGAHKKELFAWTTFAKQRGVAGGERSVEVAKAQVHDAARALASPAIRIRLPWPNRAT